LFYGLITGGNVSSRKRDDNTDNKSLDELKLDESKRDGKEYSENLEGTVTDENNESHSDSAQVQLMRE